MFFGLSPLKTGSLTRIEQQATSNSPLQAVNLITAYKLVDLRRSFASTLGDQKKKINKSNMNLGANPVLPRRDYFLPSPYYNRLFTLSIKTFRIFSRPSSSFASKRSTKTGWVLEALTKPQPSSKSTLAPSTSITI